eukprot:3210808-Ditylum_brightwellii.AAC.1
MKRHTHCYFGDNAMTDDVPASDAMDIADIMPSTDDAHKRIFYKRVQSNSHVEKGGVHMDKTGQNRSVQRTYLNLGDSHHFETNKEHWSAISNLRHQIR